MENAQPGLQPIVVRAGTGPFFDLGDHRGHGKMGARSTGGAFVLFDMTVDPGGHVPLHRHTREDETFYILEGRFSFQVGEETVEAGPGDTVFAPRNLAHAWRCVGPGPGSALVLITPGDNFEAFSIEMAQRGMTPSAAKAEPARAAEFMALAQRYGMTMLPPAE